MAERPSVTTPCVEGQQSSNRRGFDIVDGWVNIVRSLEQVPYTIPQYPTHCVDLLHVKLQDGDVEFDAFVEIHDEQGAPVVPSAIFVDDGFFLQVCVPIWQYFNGACNYYHDSITVYCMLDIT